MSPPSNIFPNDGTIQQLKSAGNLRLIHRQQISGGIMAYDQKMRQSLFEMGDEVQIRAEYRTLAVKVFNTTIFNEMVRFETTIKPANNPKLFSENAGLINEFIGAAQYIKRVNQAQVNTTRQLLSRQNNYRLTSKKNTTWNE